MGNCNTLHESFLVFKALHIKLYSGLEQFYEAGDPCAVTPTLKAWGSHGGRWPGAGSPSFHVDSLSGP